MIFDYDIRARFQKNVTMPKSSKHCWGWDGILDHAGYGRFRLFDKYISSSRASYLIYRGEIKDDFQVCHFCDNPECSNPSHLFLGTIEDNIKDSKNKGRMTRRNLSSLDRSLIKMLNQKGKCPNSISYILNIGERTVRNVLKKCL